ncbi:Uncharacterized protein dnl_22220 [Desulfonema limicola]|uniref:Uncharacterized protein n=1 Tax=Desulfonema limicola TaxID=45656 RepID=A0A975B7E6_9BACT|nr:hypothetical protein [Desulfonema limicola]QTA79940.1 Uncharacterized protein dnl_22220 [Desulfonema limicola]
MNCVFQTHPIRADWFNITEEDTDKKISLHNLLLINEQIERDSRFPLNESYFEQMIETIGIYTSVCPEIFRLILTRLTELAVLTAGNYADACEFTAAGDFLVNPKHIDIHIKGFNAPVRKHRHLRISEQLAPLMDFSNPIRWLINNTFTHIRKKAILPCLRDMLKASGRISPDYLETLDKKMCRIADTIAFLMSWKVENLSDLHDRLQAAGRNERLFVEKKLCRFNKTLFNEIGKDIQVITNDTAVKRYFFPKAVIPGNTPNINDSSLCHY